MSDIAPIGRPSAASIGSTHRAVASTTSQATTRGSDKVELSYASRMLSKLRQLPDVRQDLIDRVRGEIAGGNYETDDKIDAMLSNLMEDLG